MSQQTHLTYHKPSHRPLATAHLAQTMSLLEMNNQELLEKLEGELANNPALELIEDQHCPTCNRKIYGNLPCPQCSFSSSSNFDSPIVYVSSQHETYTPKYRGSDAITPEDFSPTIEDLPTYVLGQIGSELTPEERPITAYILTHLDEDGLLRTPKVEIALYHHISISMVDKILSKLHRCDPIGVGAQNPQEALLVQLKILNESQEIDPLVFKAISEGFTELSKHHYKSLAKSLNISIKKVKVILKFINNNLNPYPARTYWGDVRHRTESGPVRYHNPDVYISCYGNGEEPQLLVEIIWPISGTLRVNPAFQKALGQAPPEKNDQWNSDYQKANLLVKCLGQRNHTIVQLMLKLAKKQRKFILKGDKHSKPLTRAKLSEELEVHESTISRAVAGKSVQLPNGKIIPISKFFDRSLHIRTVMKEIIENETTPLSDTRIAEILIEEGYNIARRTVAKYRSMEGILPAHLRKNS